MPNKYEQLRARNMAINATKLQSLGIVAFAVSPIKPPPQNRKKRSRDSQPTRESQRVKALPAPLCAPHVMMLPLPNILPSLSFGV